MSSMLTKKDFDENLTFFFHSPIYNSIFIKNPTNEYLLITPDRSLIFAAMEYFMSSVRKASALYPGIIVVIDMHHVSAADFTTAYVINTSYKKMI